MASALELWHMSYQWHTSIPHSVASALELWHMSYQWHTSIPPSVASALELWRASNQWHICISHSSQWHLSISFPPSSVSQPTQFPTLHVYVSVHVSMCVCVFSPTRTKARPQ